MKKASRIILSGALLFVVAFTSCKQDDGRIPLTTKSKAARAHYRAGEHHLDCMRVDSARLEFADAVKADSEFALAYLGLSMTQPVSGRMYSKATAAEALSRPETKPRSQQARVGLVLPVPGGTGSPELFEQAAKRIERVSEGERLVILARKAFMEDDRKAELAHLTKLVEQYPRDEQAHQLLATYYSRMLDFSKAVPEYQQAIACNADSPNLYNLLGYCYVKQERYDEAAAAFRRYIELLPNEANPYDSYAELLLTMNRHEESLDNYRKAIARDSSFLSPRIGAAVNLLFLGQFADAEQFLQLPLGGGRAPNPNEQRTLLYTRAALAFAQKDTITALALLRERVRVAQADSMGVWEMFEALDLLGSVYGRLGQPDSAAAAFQKCLEIAQFTGLPPMLRTLWEAMYHGRMAGWVALPKNDLEAAGSQLKEMEKLIQGGNSPEVEQLAHFVRGRIALASGRSGEAVDEFKLGLQDDPLVLYYLGLAYRDNHDAAKAQEQFAKALKRQSLKCLLYVLIEPNLQAAAKTAM